MFLQNTFLNSQIAGAIHGAFYLIYFVLFFTSQEYFEVAQPRSIAATYEVKKLLQ